MEGTHLAWTANADLTGANPSNGYELYLSTFDWQVKTVLEDVNNDDAINAIDVQLVINAALGLPTSFNCDVNEDGVVKVKLQGACAGCPMSQMTLKMGIEKILKQNVPEVSKVESV